ncbi:TetR family transcriptional regulator [Rhizorhabdus wittichii DC-6]|uniref:Transcriptional regulator, TetR family n=2 Tax=Rhizorhabdus wittichii TaxID=160791 RepID=A0A9J9H856_RHIWR|nr:TetR/AcrR family transcriptional regulator [Rhizorhabdus wittichii]ABQ66736.1 transcriptional regulator, TetR family [Rhizorhabdus wittichii RW1]ARR56699.1 TetR family transcriptional regulator [Rhizorhabdus wittichii DC-6]QTH22683.1 TetR/AcrR family transcriptional regulator [Rhizorhabdus wittichii]
MSNAAAIDAAPEPRTRRRRRTREDVVERIRAAARELFAERGYAFATTKEIARLADVSETLLFRYYGDKATLFDEVVTAPFNRLMEDFVALHPDPRDPNRDADARRFVRAVYTLFEQNQEMFRALLFQMPADGRGQPALPFGGLDNFFEKSTTYAAQDGATRADTAIAVRLGFGMIASAVLFQPMLFPPHTDREALIAALEQMIADMMWRGRSD